MLACARAQLRASKEVPKSGALSTTWPYMRCTATNDRDRLLEQEFQPESLQLPQQHIQASVRLESMCFPEFSETGPTWACVELDKIIHEGLDQGEVEQGGLPPVPCPRESGDSS